MNKPALKKLVIAMSEYERIYGEFPPEHLATILAMELLNSNIEIQKIKEEQKYDFILLDRWIYSHIAFANTYGIDQSIINEPKVILADEPTGNLDTFNTELILEILLRIKIELKKTIILVTHDKGICKFADRIIEMKNGKLQEQNIK